MIGAISHTPYFAKYLRSQLPSAEGGKQIMRVLAQRLIELGPSWDHKMLHPPTGREPGYYESAAGTAIQLLSTLMAAFIKEPKESPILLTKETKAALLPWLKKWEKRYIGKEFLGMVCNRTRVQLEGNAEIRKDAKEVRRALKNWMICGKPGCESTSSLKTCGRSVMSLFPNIPSMIYHFLYFIFQVSDCPLCECRSCEGYENCSPLMFSLIVLSRTSEGSLGISSGAP
jgi:hypothetical protein